ncbi:MAG: hypothetical protein M0Z27_10495, partial [Thermaerobacter sp.]|nr:hypothetical protein [Thermaerobacter sp.]
MNYAETIAHWHLPLNGFFPLSDFVLHRTGEPGRELDKGMAHSVDCDLLAACFPHSYEEIYGQQIDWDSSRFKGWVIDLTVVTLGLMVEVKSRKSLAPEDVRTFQPARLCATVRRLGMVPRRKAQDLARALDSERVVSCTQTGRRKIAKLLVARQANRSTTERPWFFLALEDADRFILRRMKKYREAKSRDRMFFPSE